MEIVLVLAGVVVGLAISLVINHYRSVGALRIDKSDPTDNPYLFLEIKKGVGDIGRKKFVIFEVKREDFIPHE